MRRTGGERRLGAGLRERLQRQRAPGRACAGHGPRVGRLGRGLMRVGWAGAPQREAAVDEKTQREMMAFWHKKQVPSSAARTVSRPLGVLRCSLARCIARGGGVRGAGRAVEPAAGRKPG